MDAPAVRVDSRVTESFRPCFIIPVYNHASGLRCTIAALAHMGLPCIVVDDGSERECASAVAALTQQHVWIETIRRHHNGGKGAAVKDALRRAFFRGYSHALQIDSDGQHNIDDVAAFLAAAAAQPLGVVTGSARFDASVPRVREIFRRFTQLWVHINTWSMQIEDSMCGFRVYPIAETIAVIDQQHTGDRMEFDIEVLVKLKWRGTRVTCVPTLVRYPPDGVSHFSLLRDNALISWMHARCFFGMLVRAPLWAARRLRRPVGTL